MPAKKLKDYLNQEKIKYVSVYHSPTYTAQEIAETAHVPGKELAKTVIVKLDRGLAMVVLPASYHVDFEQLKRAVGAKKVDLAEEAKFKDLFPDCDIGAMPPFGNLYGLDVYVAESLAEEEEIAFNAGSHHELLKLSYADFHRLVTPTVIKFSEKLQT